MIFTILMIINVNFVNKRTLFYFETNEFYRSKKRLSMHTMILENKFIDIYITNIKI